MDISDPLDRRQALRCATRLNALGVVARVESQLDNLSPAICTVAILHPHTGLELYRLTSEAEASEAVDLAREIRAKN